MADWNQLREVGHQVSPPAFESLAATAGKRDRRARTVGLGAVFLAVIGGGIGLAAVNDDDNSDLQPVKDPSPSVTVATEETRLPDGVLPLPEPEAGDDFAILDAGRYQVPLSDTLAFQIDLPLDAEANTGGLYLSSGRNILKVEVAGESYGVPSDPCSGQYIVAVGPTVDDLVEAIRDQPIIQVSRPEPAQIGGADGTYLEIRVPAGYDPLDCEGSQVGLPGNPGSKNNMEPGYVGYWWILDVDGQRVVVQQFCERCKDDRVDRIARAVRTITFTHRSREPAA